MLSQYLTPLLLILPLAQAGISAIDFQGTARLRVLKSNNWQTASPKQTIGCISDKGTFVANDDKACGVFTRLNSFPYTISSRLGNCTFEDSTQQRNTDSAFGQSDFAYTCSEGHVADIYDQFFTMVRHSYCILSSYCLSVMSKDFDFSVLHATMSLREVVLTHISGRLPRNPPLLRGLRVLLRCPARSQTRRDPSAVAVPLGRRPRGHYSGPRPAATHVGARS